MAKTTILLGIGKVILKAYKADRKNRYSLNQPWEVGKIRPSRPDYLCDRFAVIDDILTIFPYDDCDGSTLSPDYIFFKKLKPIIAALAHDAIYPEIGKLAKAWGISISEARKWADEIMYGINMQYARPVARIYYRFVRLFGGLFTLCSIAFLSVLLTFSPGSCTPHDPFLGDPIPEPDYTKIAKLYSNIGYFN